MSNAVRPIIIVTGANGGVGFEFRQKSTRRAEIARTKLLRLLNAHIAGLQKQPGYDGYAHQFRENVVIDTIPLDLAAISNVFNFADEVSSKYPYVSHLICNAGIAGFSRIDWVACFKQLFTDPMGSITTASYYLQHVGDLSADGLGLVWQCNLFGHYVVFRSIQHLLLVSPHHLGSRVVWMSSLSASPTLYEPDDWQLTRTDHAYESSKYQIDLIGTVLDRRALHSSDPSQTRHFVTEPGICSTNVSHALVGPILDIFKLISFYIGRFFGSPYHTIDVFKAAIGAVHLSLASLVFITLWPASTGKGDDVAPPGLPVKFGAETDWWGTERVGLREIKDWEEYKGEGEALLIKCEALFQSFKSTHQSVQSEHTI